MEGWCEGIDVDVDDSQWSTWASRPTYVVGLRSVVTFALLSMSLALGVAQYLCMLAFRLDTAADDVRQRWWRQYQWGCHAAVALFVAGTLSFGYTISVVTRIVFSPDVEMLLHYGGSSGGLFDLAQNLMLAVVAAFFGSFVVNLLLAGYWRVLDVRAAKGDRTQEVMSTASDTQGSI